MSALKKLFKTMARFTPGNGVRVGLLRRCGYVIGNDVYIGEGFLVSDELDVRGNLEIGDRVSISPRVTIVTSSSPNFAHLGKYSVLKRGKVTINNDSWIGAGAILLPGVTIGEHSIVAAGAVVAEDVPPRTLVGGVPAKVMKKLEVGDVSKAQNDS